MFLGYYKTHGRTECLPYTIHPSDDGYINKLNIPIFLQTLHGLGSTLLGFTVLCELPKNINLLRKLQNDKICNKTSLRWTVLSLIKLK